MKHGYLTVGDIRHSSAPDDALIRVDGPRIYADIDMDLWAVSCQYDEAHPGPGPGPLQTVNRLRLIAVDADREASADNPVPDEPSEPI
jgi:hypothetical protein